MEENLKELYDLLMNDRNALSCIQIESLIDDFTKKANQKLKVNNSGKYIIEFYPNSEFNGLLICNPNKKTVQSFEICCDSNKRIVVFIEDANELYVVNANIESYVESDVSVECKQLENTKKSTSTIILNVIWAVLGGAFASATWAISGLLWCVTIIGIPIGKQCFKLAKLTFAPFGKEVEFTESGTKTFVNIIWLLLTGIYYAISFAIIGAMCYVTIIGIPFGKQYMKFAKLSLMPFGAKIIDKKCR